MKPSLSRRAGAEAIAAFMLVFAGCGAIVAAAARGGSIGATGVAAAFGLVIMAMVYATGHLSGAHINPAVSLAFMLVRRLSLREATAYIAAQCAGAVAAGFLLRAVWPDLPGLLGVTVPTISESGAVVYEMTMTACLMFVIMAVATDARAAGATAAIAIGGVVTLGALYGGAATGASMNPARSLGPALAVGEWRSFWIYVVGPVAGASLGAFVYQLIRGSVVEPVLDAGPDEACT